MGKKVFNTKSEQDFFFPQTQVIVFMKYTMQVLQGMTHDHCFLL